MDRKLRDLVSTILESRITLQGNQLNEVMKKLISSAAIIAIPTAVTGFYGQNVFYPGFQQRWGFLSSIILILGIGLYCRRFDRSAHRGVERGT